MLEGSAPKKKMCSEENDRMGEGGMETFPVGRVGPFTLLSYGGVILVLASRTERGDGAYDVPREGL